MYEEQKIVTTFTFQKPDGTIDTTQIIEDFDFSKASMKYLDSCESKLKAQENVRGVKAVKVELTAHDQKGNYKYDSRGNWLLDVIFEK